MAKCVHGSGGVVLAIYRLHAMVEEKAHCAAPTRLIRLWPNGAVLLVVDPGGQVSGGPGGVVFFLWVWAASSIWDVARTRLC